jgi:hypothetical protein
VYASVSRPSSSAQPAVDQRITIFYKSGWSEVVLHGSVEGSEWRDYQLAKVKKVEVAGYMFEHSCAMVNLEGSPNIRGGHPGQR